MNARKPRTVQPNQPRPPEDADVRTRLADFSDAESVRVLDAAVVVLVEVLARQAARECFAQCLLKDKELR